MHLDNFALKLVIDFLRPIDLVRLSGTCQSIRSVVSSSKLTWSRFLRVQVAPDMTKFIEEPLNRRARFMIVKSSDLSHVIDRMLVTDTEKYEWVRDILRSDPVTTRLVFEGVLSIFKIARYPLSGLRALHSMMQLPGLVDPNHLVELHRHGVFSLNTLFEEAIFIGSRLSIVGSLNCLRYSHVRKLLETGKIRFLDLILQDVHDDLQSARLSELVQRDRLTLPRLARLTVKEKFELKSDFIWQYVRDGVIDVEFALKIPLYGWIALEQRDLYDLVQQKELDLRKCFELPPWTMYHSNILRLWCADIVTIAQIELISGNWVAQDNIRQAFVYDLIFAGILPMNDAMHLTLCERSALERKMDIGQQQHIRRPNRVYASYKKFAIDLDNRPNTLNRHC